MQKKKVLWYSDSPVINSGFGIVAREILKSLYSTGEYEFEIVGINHYQSYYDQSVYPYKIHMNFQQDMYALQSMSALIKQGNYDILFMLTDVDIAAQLVPLIDEIKKVKEFKVIHYFPIDAEKIPSYFFEYLNHIDYPVTYTEFGERVVLKHLPALKDKLTHITHGTDTKNFFPISESKRKKFKKERLGMNEDMFLVLNVNRNQWRKDFRVSIQAFRKFNYLHPKSQLYLHTAINDIGGNVAVQADSIGLKKDLLITPTNYSVQNSVPIEMMNLIYNAADVVISSTVGEGWGLSVTEAFATRRPVVVPKNTSLVEMVGEKEERGYFANSGTSEDLWSIAYGNSNFLHPVTEVASLAAGIEKVYNDKIKDGSGEYFGITAKKLDLAFIWAKENTWEKVNNQWIEIFKKASL